MYTIASVDSMKTRRANNCIDGIAFAYWFPANIKTISFDNAKRPIETGAINKNLFESSVLFLFCMHQNHSQGNMISEVS